MIIAVQFGKKSKAGLLVKKYINYYLYSLSKGLVDNSFY